MCPASSIMPPLAKQAIKVVDLTVDGASHVTAEKVADLGRKVLAYQRLLLVNAGLPIG